jgi:hypothetical protein
VALDNLQVKENSLVSFISFLSNVKNSVNLVRSLVTSIVIRYEMPDKVTESLREGLFIEIFAKKNLRLKFQNFFLMIKIICFGK